MYFFRDAETGRIVNVVIGDNLPNLYKENHEPISLKQLIFDQLDSYKLLGEENQPTRIILSLDTPNPTVYTIAKKSYGEPVGYRICDLVYAGDLITTVGETLTSVLDKIKNMLSCFEYFYDIDGRFIFQRKKFYDFKSWNNIVKKSEGESYIKPAVYSSSYTYSFKDSQIVTQFANNPQINILRNDFSIWGQRKSASGEELPIHMRYAIDTKPVQYTTIIVTQDDINRYKTLTYNNEIFQTMNLQLKQQTFKAYPEDGDPVGIIYCDWREIIYRMAVDYYQYNYGDDFLHKVAAANPTLYPSGVTGYETYYADIFSFWRQIYDFEHRTFYDNVKQYPENLDFWFDFIGEENSDISKYSIKLIGDRTKAVNDTNIKVISYRDVPEVLFLNQGDYDRIVENNYPQETGYVWVNVPKNYDNYFSSASYAAFREDKDMLYSMRHEPTLIEDDSYAKQIAGYFRNGDNFDKAKTHAVGSVVAGDITAAEIAASVFTYSAADANGAPKAFIKANAALTKGVPQIGAMVVPAGARQAFITSDFNADMKSQYSSNASEAAAQINATGYMNPFTQTESVRINESTGLCGMYDGVGLYLLNESTKAIVYIYLGVAGTANDADSTLAACRASLDKIAGFIVYGAGTCRGIAVAPTITVSPEPYNAQMVVIAPLMKMGVDVLHGASIKVITNAALTATEIAALVNKVKFTPIDDDGTLALAALPDYDFNDGTTK